MIEERLKCLQEYRREDVEMPVCVFPFVHSDCGTHSELYQSDLSSWLMKEADVPFTVEDMVVLVLIINLAAIHVSGIGTWLRLMSN